MIFDIRYTCTLYIYTRIFTFFIFIYTYIYIFHSNIHTVLYTYSITVWTHTHTFESTDVGSIYFVANPRKWWSIESSLLLRLSNPVEIAVVTLQQAGEVVGTGCVVNCCVLPKDPLNPRLTKKHIVSYTPVNEHSNGKWTIWRCISYWNWGCSIAMLVYQRVVILAVHLFTNSFLLDVFFAWFHLHHKISLPIIAHSHLLVCKTCKTFRESGTKLLESAWSHLKLHVLGWSFPTRWTYPP